MITTDNNPPTKIILLITTLTAFMTAFMGSSINIALPIIGIEFKASAILLSWISTAYLVSTAALLLPVGKLTDIYGRTLSEKKIIPGKSTLPLQSFKPGIYFIFVNGIVAGKVLIE